jgi:hypothetical protein
MLVVNLIRAALVLLTALLVLVGVTGVPIYLLALACLSLNRFFLAGLGASLPYVVPRHELVMANAVSPTCGTVAAVLGVGLGYLPRLLLGSGDGTDALALCLGAAGYASSALLARRMPRSLLGPEHRAPLDWRSLRAAARDFAGDLVAGGRHVRERRPAAFALATIGAHRLGYGVMTITLMLLCRNYFTDPEDVDAGLALLATSITVIGAGVGLAALVTPPAARRLGAAGCIAASVGLAAVVQLILVIHASVPTLFAAALLTGMTGQCAKICVDSVVQRNVDEGFRGRVFAFYDVIFNAAFVAAAGLSLLLLPEDGYSRGVFTGIGAWFALISLGYLLAQRTVRERDDEPQDDDEAAASGLDLEDEPGLATQLGPGTGRDHGRHSGFDRHRRATG